jgi:hypothetical protein
MNPPQLWQARAEHARRSARETKNEGQRALLLLYAEECERKAARCRGEAEPEPAVSSHSHRAGRLLPA